MLIPNRKFCFSLLAAGSIGVGGILTLPAAQAQTACVSNTKIQQIVDDGGYTCKFGSITYEFNDSLNELASTADASISFMEQPDFQRIEFKNLATNGLIYFNYQLNSPIESITDIEQTYTPYPMVPSPEPPPADFNASGIRATPGLPSNPSTVSVEVTATIENDGSLDFTSLTHTIYKTPSALPLIGIGSVFAFSRTLRQRIKRSC